jgi:hypothetical protein
MPHRGALDDRLDCRSGDPEPEQPDDGLHSDDDVVTSATDGGLLPPLKRSARKRANAPERHYPQEDEETHDHPADATGTGQPISSPLVLDDPSGI